jgi:hypothetical protein
MWPKCAVHEAGEMMELELALEFQGRPPVIRAILISSVHIVSGMVGPLWRQPDFGPVPALQLGTVILGGVASKASIRSQPIPIEVDVLLPLSDDNQLFCISFLAGHPIDAVET